MHRDEAMDRIRAALAAVKDRRNHIYNHLFVPLVLLPAGGCC